MNTLNNTDYGFLGLTLARIAEQIKDRYALYANFRFNHGNNELVITLHDKLTDADIYKRTLMNISYDPRELCDEVFEHCINNDLFKIPMDIKLVD